jgi:hypothetical protein
MVHHQPKRHYAAHGYIKIWQFKPSGKNMKILHLK